MPSILKIGSDCDDKSLDFHRLQLEIEPAGRFRLDGTIRLELDGPSLGLPLKALGFGLPLIGR